MKNRQNVKILLLQSRLDPNMRAQEYECYIKFSGLTEEQLEDHYILEERFDINHIETYDAVIIWGTGDFEVHHVKEKYPNAYEDLVNIANHCRREEMPVLSVCMQYWAVIFGWEVKTDLDRQEVGTFCLYKTEEAKNDPLFCDLPDTFKAQVGHKDYVSTLPEGSVLLVNSDLCPTHAYRTGKKEYILQFHPELDKNALIKRLEYYRSYTPDNPEEFDALIESLEDTPDSISLMRKFIDRIVLEN